MKAETERKKNTATLLPIHDYDKVIVSFSGGKDSVACVLHLLSLGVRDRLELWHQEVDGRGEDFMDWPCTKSYCEAFAKAFDVPCLFQWRDGGFRREMLKDNEQSAPVSFEDFDDDGRKFVRSFASARSKVATRLKFPQVGADLRTRWCSSALKIEVCSRAINNSPRLGRSRILLVTGERGEESPNRAKYQHVEKHRCSSKKRTVHQYRPIQDWSEQQVWNILRDHRVNPHPAYHLGFGRVSCGPCIFGNNDQWSSVRDLLPTQFAEIAEHEEAFGFTIHRSLDVVTRADAGTSYTYDEDAKALALSTSYPLERILTPEGEWRQPQGAYRRCGGPS